MLENLDLTISLFKIRTYKYVYSKKMCSAEIIVVPDKVDDFIVV